MDWLRLYAKKIMRKTNTINFKKTLGKFTTGVTVVCLKNKEVIYGKTVNSFNSLSLKPPLVLFSLGNYSSSIKNFLKSEYISINILSKKQKDLSINFAKTKPNFKKIKFKYGLYDTPIIDGCIGNLECKLLDTIKKGDHIIFINKVLSVYNNDKLMPLSYYNSKYY